MILYLWLLLTIPSDRYICELWTRELTRAAIVQACGVEVESISSYRVDVYENGVKICDLPAVDILFAGESCNLHKKYDAYRLRVVEPEYQEWIGCNVKTSTPAQPTPEQVREQCPAAINYEIRSGGTITPTPPPSVCMPPAISQPESIATQKDLHLLAARLIWYGYARGNCPNGLSGLDMRTNTVTACGMDGARADVIAWQNSLDDAILRASREWNVPAVTLKTLIERETQFWAWTGSDGEMGLIQITEEGAGNVLHVYETGYYRMTSREQAQARAAWLRSLACDYCTPKQVIEKAKQDMSKYAQALAAYYCMYGNWNAALTAWNIKHKEN